MSHPCPIDFGRELTDGTRENRLLSVSEVAEFLKIPKSSVYGLVLKNKLPKVQALNVVRIRQADLEEFIGRS